MGRSVRLKSFELVARDIRDVDVKLLHALSIAVGWPHRPKDWDFLRRAGLRASSLLTASGAFSEVRCGSPTDTNSPPSAWYSHRRAPKHKVPADG
ncbi:hypothetical protein ACVWZV_002503 [Bradyrhizobium sp. GM5.1]